MTNAAYIIAREALTQVGALEGKLFDAPDAAHYRALAVLAALETAGYRIEKKVDT